MIVWTIRMMWDILVSIAKAVVENAGNGDATTAPRQDEYITAAEALEHLSIETRLSVYVKPELITDVIESCDDDEDASAIINAVKKEFDSHGVPEKLQDEYFDAALAE